MSTFAPSRLSAEFDAEHLDLRESVQTFLRREVVPELDGWRKQGQLPRALAAAAVQKGFSGSGIPMEHGGLGVGDPRFGRIVVEEAMRAGAEEFAVGLLTQEVAVSAMVRSGRTEVFTRLAELAAGERIATVVDGELIRDGSFISGKAELVAATHDADLFLAICRSEGNHALALLERDDGVRVCPLEAPVGLESAGLGRVEVESGSALWLGEEAAVAAVDTEHCLMLAAAAVAGTEAVLGEVAQYVGDRHAFGRPIADFGNTRAVLARAWAEARAASALSADAFEGWLRGEGSLTIAVAAKLVSGDVFEHVVDSALQLHGGYGYITEYPVARAFTGARFWQFAGPPASRITEVIAATVLGPSTSSRSIQGESG